MTKTATLTSTTNPSAYDNDKLQAAPASSIFSITKAEVLTFQPRRPKGAPKDTVRPAPMFSVVLTHSDGSTMRVPQRFPSALAALEYAHRCAAEQTVPMQTPARPADNARLPAPHPKHMRDTTTRAPRTVRTVRKETPTVAELVQSHGPVRAWRAESNRLNRALEEAKGELHSNKSRSAAAIAARTKVSELMTMAAHASDKAAQAEKRAAQRKARKPITPVDTTPTPVPAKRSLWQRLTFWFHI